MTALRCSAIDLRLVADAQPVLRRWLLAYTQDPLNASSLLRTIVLRGFDAVNASLDTPPLTLGYSSFAAPQFGQLTSADGLQLPALGTATTARVDLVDWNGDGLPDLIEVGAGGSARVRANRGDATFAPPLGVGTLPQFAQPNAALAFIDMDGDAIADLVRVDQPLAGYVPRIEGGGFGLPVRWTQAPSVIPAAARARLIDLDGDGIADLLTSTPDGSFALYFRNGAQGWREMPQVVAPSAAPGVDLGDPHVFMADMTGDGSPDVVRVDGGGVTYWPYLGNGRWDAPIAMADPPQLPFNVRPERVFVSDVDGDGCADVIYIADESVTYWINRCGAGFSGPYEIAYVPGAVIGVPRLADMKGSGTPGLLWSTGGPLGRGTRYFYLDFPGRALVDDAPDRSLNRGKPHDGRCGEQPHLDEGLPVPRWPLRRRVSRVRGIWPGDRGRSRRPERPYPAHDHLVQYRHRSGESQSAARCGGTAEAARHSRTLVQARTLRPGRNPASAAAVRPARAELGRHRSRNGGRSGRDPPHARPNTNGLRARR